MSSRLRQSPYSMPKHIEALINQYPSLAGRRHAAAGSLSGGEHAMVNETLERITTLTAQGIGILTVEQNIREAMPIADRLYILTAGEKRFEGSPRDVRDDRQIMDIIEKGAGG